MNWIFRHTTLHVSLTASLAVSFPSTRYPGFASCSDTRRHGSHQGPHRLHRPTAATLENKRWPLPTYTRIRGYVATAHVLIAQPLPLFCVSWLTDLPASPYLFMTKLARWPKEADSIRENRPWHGGVDMSPGSSRSKRMGRRHGPPPGFGLVLVLWTLCRTGLIGPARAIPEAPDMLHYAR